MQDSIAFTHPVTRAHFDTVDRATSDRAHTARQVPPSSDPAAYQALASTRDDGTKCLLFSGLYDDITDFLGNFYESPITITCLDGNTRTFQTIEHAYQAHKFVGFPNARPDIADRIAQQRTPNSAWQIGQAHRRHKNPHWAKVNQDIMLGLVQEKFRQNATLAAALKATAPLQLVEYAPLNRIYPDTFWGVDRQGLGTNHLGQILEIVRDKLDRDESLEWTDDNREAIRKQLPRTIFATLIAWVYSIIEWLRTRFCYSCLSSH